MKVKDRFQTTSSCHFQQLAQFPLTSSGDVDQEELERFVEGEQQAQQKNVVPATTMERTIATIWQEVLGLEKVSVYDKFFSLGGHSLRMSQVHSKMQSVLNQNISMVDLFKYPTIQALAQFLTQGEQAEDVFEESNVRADMRRERYQRRAQHQRRERQEKEESQEKEVHEWQK